MNLIKREDFKDNELYQFIVNTFKQGMMPEDIEKFKSCFNYETTDGSLCFSYKFGNGKDDWVALFFYPLFCAVPIPYQQHLRDQSYCKINNLILEYQFMLAKKIDSLEYLELLAQEVETRYEINIEILKARVNSFSDEEAEENFDDMIDKRIKSMEEFTIRYNEVCAFINKKLADLKNKDNTCEDEAKNILI